MRVCGWSGKTCGKKMSAERKMSRRFDRVTRARARSALSDCIVRTVLFVGFIEGNENLLKSGRSRL